MIDYLLVAGAFLVLAVGLTVGYAVGQGLCRRDVRSRLWILFYEMDAEPGAAKAKYDVLNLIKKLELN